MKTTKNIKTEKSVAQIRTRFENGCTREEWHGRADRRRECE